MDMDTRTRTHTCGSTITPGRGMGTGSSLICLLHMSPIPVKLLSERAAAATALTPGERNYLPHATLSVVNLTLTSGSPARALPRHGDGVQTRRRRWWC